MQILIIFFGLFLVFFSPKHSISCQRVEGLKGDCVITHSGFLWSKTREIPLERLEKASLYSNPKRQQSDSSVVLFINSIQGTEPEKLMDTSFKSEKKTQELIQQVNGFLTNPKMERLEVVGNNNWWVFVGGLTFFAGFYPMARKWVQ